MQFEVIYYDPIKQPPVRTNGGIADGGRKTVSKNDELCIKNDELCIKNDELCIKNDKLCIKDEELFIKNEEWCIEWVRRRMGNSVSSELKH